MAIYEAKVYPSWVRDTALKSLLFFAFAAYFVYDGAIAWPKRNVVAHEYLRFIDAGNSKYDWPAHAAKMNFGKVKPVYTHEHIKDQRQLNEQFYWAGGLSLIGIGILGWIAMNVRKVLSYDETAIISPEGKRVPLDSIKEISTEKWEKKGLAYLRYEEGGELRKITLDDLKYDGAEKVLERAQAHLGLPLESELRAAAKARVGLESGQTEEDAQPLAKED